MKSGSGNAYIYHGGAAQKKGFSGSTIDTDVKVKASPTDTTANFLTSKIGVANGMSKVLKNPGGDEYIELSPPNIVKASTADVFPNSLYDKISAGTGISKAILNPGADELLQLSATLSSDGKVKVSSNDTTPNFLDSKIQVLNHIDKQVVNEGANEHITLDGVSQFTLYYSNAADYIVALTFFSPPDYGLWNGTHRKFGYYSCNGFILKKVIFAAMSIQTTAIRTMTIRIRTYTADGTKTALFAAGEGTNIGLYTFTFPNTNGAIRYYKGGFDVPSVEIAANQLVFIYVSTSDVDYMFGASVVLHCTKDSVPLP